MHHCKEIGCKVKSATDCNCKKVISCCKLTKGVMKISNKKNGLNELIN